MSNLFDGLLTDAEDDALTTAVYHDNWARDENGVVGVIRAIITRHRAEAADEALAGMEGELTRKAEQHRAAALRTPPTATATSRAFAKAGAYNDAARIVAARRTGDEG